MTISLQEALRQNSVGHSEGTPRGVPSGYAWYEGVYKAAAAPPAGFSSVTAWGQVYEDSGEPASSVAAAKVQVANAKTYVHLKSTGEWLLVQDQPQTGIAGGFFRTDFAGQSALSMPVTKSADGTATFAAPPAGYNNHFWPTARGTFAANNVDAVYVQMDMRVTDPGVNLVGQVGADWWRSSSAPFVHGFSNNPTAGTANWIDLSTEWRTLSFTSSNAILQADPPSVLIGGPVNIPDPSKPTTPTSPELPTTPTTPEPPKGDNMLVNGSFEAASVAAGQWADFDAIAGWTAVSGGTIELWNSLNGVRATDGSNFGELDFLGAQDGLFQTITTEAGQKYDLSFDARSRLGMTPATTAMEVLWNDSVVARVLPANQWDSHTFTVTGTGGQDRLTLREAAGQGRDGLGALYDNVSLVPTEPVGSVRTLDQSMALMTQYSAGASDALGAGASTVPQGANQESTAPLLTQTHQLS